MCMATRAIEIPRKKPGLREFLDVGNGFTPYFLVMPTILVVLAIAVYPVLNAFWFSLLNSPPGPSAGFIGWSNYFELVESPEFRGSVNVTILFTTIAVTLEAVFGLGIALLLHGTFRGRTLLQA